MDNAILYNVVNPVYREKKTSVKTNRYTNPSYHLTPSKKPGLNSVDIAVGLQDCAISCSGFYPSSPPAGGGTRGLITCLSDGSKRRMTRTIRNLDGMKTMITLTYPMDYPHDGKVVKYHWHVLKERIKYYYKQQGKVFGGIWFFEFQDRGAPHFHVLSNIRIPYRDLAQWWYEVVDSGDEKHFKAGTRIETIRKPAHLLASYAAKYATKLSQKEVPADYENVGRFWGLFGKNDDGTRYGPKFEQINQQGEGIESAVALKRQYRKYKKSLGQKVKTSALGSSAFLYGFAHLARRVQDFFSFEHRDLESYGALNIPIESEAVQPEDYNYYAMGPFYADRNLMIEV